MTAPHAQPLIEDYLARLHAAAAALPEDRRTELLEGITEHLESARAAGAAADEAAVRTLLERLGDPREIVAAAWEGGAGGVPPAVPARMTFQQWKNQPGAQLEGTALALMTFGSVVLLWPVGVWLMWQSRWWRRWEKVLGTLVVPGGPIAGFYLPLLLPSGGCNSDAGVLATTGDAPAAAVQCSDGAPQWLATTLMLSAVISSLLVAVYLWVQAKRRAGRRVEPPPGAVAPAWTGLEIAIVALLGPGALVLFFIGPVIGLFLLRLSPQWTQREKRFAQALVLASLVFLLGFALILIPLEAEPHGSSYGVLRYALLPLCFMGAAVYLWLTLRRRVAATTWTGQAE